MGAVELRPVPPPDDWLSLSETAARVGMVERTLRRWAARGLIDTRTGSGFAGKPLQLVSVSQVRRLLSQDAAKASVPALDKASEQLDRLLQTSEETSLKHAKRASLELVAELQERIRQLEQQLHASEVVEKSTARRCDKLEQQLENAHVESLSLARALGAVEAQRDAARLLAAPASQPPTLWGRLFGRSR